MLDWVSVLWAFVKNMPRPVWFLLGAIVTFCAKYLPYKWRIDKKLMFGLRTKQTSCAINVSIPVSAEFGDAELRACLDEFWRNSKSIHSTTGVEGGGAVTFNSSWSGASYTLHIVDDTQEDQKHVVVESFRGFHITFWGGIKNLDESLDELRSLAERIQTQAGRSRSVSVSVEIVPRDKDKAESLLSGKVTKGDCTYSFSSVHVEVVSNGFDRLKSTVKDIIYEWRARFF